MYEPFTSNAPSNCPDCGSAIIGEQINTGDSSAYNGWEDWRYCRACNFEAFYPAIEPATQQDSARQGGDL